MKVPLLDDGLDSGLARAFYGSQSEADLSVPVHFEVHTRFIHVRAQHIDAHVPAFLYKERDVVEVVLRMRQHGCHVFGRIIRLEVGGVIRHQGIAGGV